MYANIYAFKKLININKYKYIKKYKTNIGWISMTLDKSLTSVPPESMKRTRQK